MRHRPFIFCALALFCGTSQAWAEAPKTLVLELFTSQSCTYCPKVDELVAELADADAHIIPIVCHVDYMDTPEWPDKMARPLCKERHDAYVDALEMQRPVIPATVLNGRYPIIGSNDKLIREGVAMARSVDMVTELQLTRRDGFLDVTLPAMRLDQPTDVMLAVFGNAQTVNITAGANLGMTVDYVAPVEFLIRLFSWDGIYKNTSIPLAAYPGTGYAVIVQGKDAGPVYAAGMIKN